MVVKEEEWRESTFHEGKLVLLRPTQPGHLSVGRHNEYWWWSRSPLGKKRRVLRNSGPVPGLLA